MRVEYFFSIPFWGILIFITKLPWLNSVAIMLCIVLGIVHFKLKEIFSLSLLLKIFTCCLTISLLFIGLSYCKVYFKLFYFSVFVVLFTLYQIPVLALLLIAKIQSKKNRKLSFLLISYPILLFVGWALFFIGCNFSIPARLTNVCQLTTWINIEENYEDFIDESFCYDVRESKFLLFEKVTPIKWGGGLKYSTSFFLLSKRNDSLDIGVSWNGDKKIADTVLIYTNGKLIGDLK